LILFFVHAIFEALFDDESIKGEVMNGKHLRHVVLGTMFLLFLMNLGPLAYGQEIDCLKCHAKLKAEKVLHPAVDMGCATCHSGIDASKVPHKKTNKIDKGLSSEQPDLCYGCHDKAAFGKKNVHAAVSMGCTGCHNPHSSKNAKLLKAEAPDLCYTCHDKKAFTQKTVHMPVAGGMCLSCHSPHASDQMALLLKNPVETCLECHPDVVKKPHAIAGFAAKGHPVTAEEIAGKRKKTASPDKFFYCASCHNPHSTDVPRLFRFNAKTSMELCTNCHKY
jgi:predicted CXXCH cytochrome family protein